MKVLLNMKGIFDITYNKDVPDSKGAFDMGGATSFKLTKPNNPDIFLVLYNCHNGYYSHGFDMKINEDAKEDIFSDRL